MKNGKRPFWIAVTGPKKSEKTSVIEALIPLLKEQDYRVATLKHTPHQHTFDTTGTDSFRHAQAGAKRVGIVSSENGAFLISNLREPESALSEFHEAFFSSYDVILCEGFRNSHQSKIVLESEDEAGNEIAPPVILKYKHKRESAEKPVNPDRVREQILDYIRVWIKPSLR